ncbi:hypothetical protein [Paraburkholderia caribensis]|uniref:hypothetical protein n=1 Tax=Paraburkholderia caribensis TaxID=75105 RepID=UPI001CAFD921|nr:hypothetical protein [Paraburkholderia caribensis]CAG9253808.1 hypothetical protein PCAR4_350122 [Paraburkholderia caribensis]
MNKPSACRLGAMASANSCPLTGRNIALQRWRNHQPTAAFVTTADVENTIYPNDSFLPPGGQHEAYSIFC